MIVHSCLDAGEHRGLAVLKPLLLSPASAAAVIAAAKTTVALKIEILFIVVSPPC